MIDPHQADLDFIARVRRASMDQLQKMQADTAAEWKWVAITREIAKRRRDEEKDYV